MAIIEKYLRSYVKEDWIIVGFTTKQYVHNIRDGCTMPKGPAGHLSRATRCREQLKKVSLRANNAGRLHSIVYCCV